MKKKETTKTFSIRAEIDSIKEFENLVEKNSTNKNKVINDFMLEYIIKNTENYDSVNTEIHNNIDKLGYKKEFFNREDAEFFIQAENLLNSYPDGFLSESDILRVFHTGVKYSFTNIGLRVYSTWHFYESKENITGKLHLNFGNVSILYNEKNDVVEYMNEIDFTSFIFNDDL